MESIKNNYPIFNISSTMEIEKPNSKDQLAKTNAKHKVKRCSKKGQLYDFEDKAYITKSLSSYFMKNITKIYEDDQCTNSSLQLTSEITCQSPKSAARQQPTTHLNSKILQEQKINNFNIQYSKQILRQSLIEALDQNDYLRMKISELQASLVEYTTIIEQITLKNQSKSKSRRYSL